MIGACVCEYISVDQFLGVLGSVSVELLFLLNCQVNLTWRWPWCPIQNNSCIVGGMVSGGADSACNLLEENFPASE